MRISNFEVGYNEVEDFIEDGGFSFLPKSWQALNAEPEDSEENLWYTFTFETVKIVQQKLKDLNKYAVGGFLAFSLVMDAITRTPGKQGSYLFGSIKILTVSHGMACLAFWLVMQVVSDSNWAKDIKSGKAYQLQSPEDDAYIAPMTIPTKGDILITKAYSTDVLASYSNVLDFAHPGNRIWKNLIHEMAGEYPHLSESLKTNLCQSMVRWMQANRRFLKTNVYRQWERIVEESDLVEICHRQVIMEADELTGTMLHQLDILKDDAQYGRWRDMAIHTKFMPAYLDIWEEIFLPTTKSVKNKSSKSACMQPSKRKFLQSPFTVERSNRTRRALPPIEEPREPFSGAWLEVGDTVEGKYKCEGKDWYQGTIIDASSNNGEYTIKYFDGEIGKHMFSKCIRRPLPFEIGEEVGFRSETEEEWETGTIVEIVNAGSVKVKESSSGEVFDDISPTLLIRFTNKKISDLEGRRVMALYDNNDDYYPGVVFEDHGDGTYDIQYDDGDFREKVRLEEIEFQ